MKSWRLDKFKLSQASSSQCLLLDPMYERLDKALEDIHHHIQEIYGQLKKMIVHPRESVESKQLKSGFHGLSKSLSESLHQESSNTLLSDVTQLLSNHYETASLCEAEFHYNLERQVLANFKSLQQKIEKLQTRKKNLQSAFNDLNHAKLRLESEKSKKQQAHKKLSEDVESLFQVFTDQKESYQIKLLNFFSNEERICRVFVTLLQKGAEYHERYIDSVELKHAQICDKIGSLKNVPIFDLSLEEYEKKFGVTDNEIIKNCCDYIEQHGLNEEGIFRIEGSASEIKLIKLQFDTHFTNFDKNLYNVHSVACALKIYLRSSSDCLMSCEIYPEWLRINDMCAVNDGKISSQNVDEIQNLLQSLKPVYYKNFKCLVKLLNKIYLNQSVNRMSSAAISKIIAPSVMRSDCGAGSLLNLASDSMNYVLISLIENYDLYFCETSKESLDGEP